MPPVGLHRALLFVFSPRGDESTDWQSDGTLHDSTKPWPGRSCSIIHRKGKKERERKEGSVGVCVSVRQRGKMNETAGERERERETRKKTKEADPNTKHHLLLPDEQDLLLIITHLHWLQALPNALI